MDGLLSPYMTHDVSPCFAMASCARVCACRYGLGQIMMKQEKFAEALGHFELACTINPASSVLRCCCGLALNKMGRLEEAARQLRVGF